MNEIDLRCQKTANLSVQLVADLAAYTEEGIQMFPSVYICNSISQLVQRSGVGEHVVLAEDVETERTSASILKLGAALCSDNWKIYVQRSVDGERCSYGVFCGSVEPTSLTIDDIVLAAVEVGFPVIKISQSGNNRVELRTSAGSVIEFRFNADADDTDLPNRGRLASLAAAISKNVRSNADPFAGYIERLLVTAVRDSHGTLIAVARSNRRAIPKRLRDAVRLTPAFDLFERYRLHAEDERSTVSMGRLQAASELVAGMIKSDGITIFNSRGIVLGYRAFIRSGAKSASGGGARSRAFASLEGLLKTDLEAVFFKSQDGRTELTMAAEG